MRPATIFSLCNCQTPEVKVNYLGSFFRHDTQKQSVFHLRNLWNKVGKLGFKKMKKTFEISKELFENFMSLCYTWYSGHFMCKS